MSSTTESASPDLEPTFESVVTVLEARCALPACHGNYRLPHLFGSPELYTTLTTYEVTGCQGHPLVTPGDPSTSALLELPTFACDNIVMPQGCFESPCVDAEALAAIEGWIAAGAPP